MLTDLTPVSYTHLDVYKRQGQDIGKYKRAITPWKGGELWWEQLKKEISIRNAGLYLQKKSLKEN